MWQESSYWIYHSNTPLTSQKSQEHPREDFLFLEGMVKVTGKTEKKACIHVAATTASD